MDPISSFILTKSAEAIIGTLVGEGTKVLITKLQGDPAQKALKKALGEALTRYVASQPDRKLIAQPLLRRASLLTEPEIANELAQVVKFSREPDASLIGKRWRDELENPPTWRDFTSEANLFIDYFKFALKATPVFAPAFEVARLDAIAANAEISAESLASVEKLLSSLISLMDSQFGVLARAIAGSSTSIRDQVRDFADYIAEKATGFVGRRFIIKEIQEFIDTNPRGYFLLYGDPGIGKSAISAYLVKNYGFIHYFNIRADGINKASDFLRSVCGQLISKYSLNYTFLPPEATQDAGFLSRLLNEVSEKIGQNEKCVILVDALDEAEELSPRSGANVMFLPRTLPQGIFIVATSRREPKEKLRLRIEIPEQLTRDLKQDESGNHADIAEYIEGQVSNLDIQAYINRQQISNELFIGHMVDKAQGNFIYLRYVLPAIERGAYTNLALEQIPAGLKNYYEDNWLRIRQENGLDWFKSKLPVVVALTIVKEPVSADLLAEFSGIDSKPMIRAVLNDFDQFLYKIDVEYQGSRQQRYRWYHGSFFQFISDKENVAEEHVSLKEANKKVSSRLLTNLFGDNELPSGS